MFFKNRNTKKWAGTHVPLDLMRQLSLKGCSKSLFLGIYTFSFFISKWLENAGSDE